MGVLHFRSRAGEEARIQKRRLVYSDPHALLHAEAPWSWREGEVASQALASPMSALEASDT